MQRSSEHLDHDDAVPAQQPARNLCCLIVDDHLIFAQMLGTLLTTQMQLEVPASPSTVASSLPALEQWRPDLLILDLELPDGNGLEVAEHFALLQPAGKIIVLSGHSRHFSAPSHLRRQIVAVIDKANAYELIAATVRDLISAGAADATQVDDQDYRQLTPRESEVFDQLGTGLTTKEIARALHLSVFTVATHRKNIASKLGTSGPELLRLATLRHQRRSRIS